jgi:hypothetical protein
MLGGDFSNYLHYVLATLSMTSGHHVFAAMNDAFDQGVLRSWLLVVVTGFVCR